MTYCELQVTTHYSFLRGASSPEQLFEAAALAGMPALGIVDRNSVGGIVRGLVAAEEITARGVPIRLVPGCRLDLVDGASLLVWPEDRAAWSRLTRLLTLGKGRAHAQKGEKGRCFLHWEDVAAHAQGLVAALVPGLADTGDMHQLRWMADIFDRERGHLCLTQHRRPGEARRLHALADSARRFGLSPIVTGDVLYDLPERRMLQDVVTAIREKCTIDELGFRRERSADRHLKSPEEMARRFRHHRHALAAVEAVVERCTFSPRDLDYQYPDEVVLSGRSPQAALEHLARTALARKFDGNPPRAYTELLEHELGLVGEMGYAPYFLTVNSIMAYARAQRILCQGRGSAANSVICYVLNITSIDPVERKLLFERFINKDRHEPPDIDVDFEHEQRERVIQWIYETYGAQHAALTAVVSRFRSRGSIREVGKALGLPEDMTAGLASQIWGWSSEGVPDAHVEALNLDKTEPRLALALDLATQLIGTPRHLSQHPGGFVLTRDRLDELVPIEPAAMVDRRVIEWEKGDIEELGFMKVDILGLGMLGCMRRCFDLLREHKGLDLDMASGALQTDDPGTYDMIQRADTLGVFQIESRAQMSMLPRMKPKEFYDLVIEVAIVRPGPIQGDMVHPYLKRREGKERVSYPNAALEAVLEKTLGVPLFQEQAMQVAIVGAGFTAAEADQLRRAMATFKMTGGVGKFNEKLVSGMRANGITQAFAERLVKQIEGFGSYGFPESHAASFAKIAYASCWMKHHHPDVFCAALLNAQPMGFYAPAQIVRDARAHGVDVLPPCVNASDWDTVLVEPSEAASRAQARPVQPSLRARSPVAFSRESGNPGPGETPTRGSRDSGLPRSRENGKNSENAGKDQASVMRHPLRLGLRIVSGLSGAEAGKLLMARAAAPFTSVEDVWRRAKLSTLALEKLARADAFHALGLDRRQALWAVRGLGAKPLPLFAAADARESGIEPPVALVPLTAGREVVEDYRATQLSLRAHPLTFLRGELTRRGMRTCGDLQHIKDGARVEVAGVILVRQRPGSAKGVLFITIEDETGIANGILWPDRFEAQRRTVMTATMVSIIGRVQKEGLVIHVVADRIVDLTPLLAQVGEIDLPRLTMPGDGATHGGTIDPRDPEWRPGRIDWHYRERAAVIPVKSHDFH
ncbi:DNA polymerase [Sphingomonas panacis]|uniref:Error-prone DNA polymerase n=1 Tax=Sphingomonas panacis TaxID=1560345 RepID=A0A1B3Z6P0_9SPHN|nr:error-prone DNA polymerase [Sphingomonas panacis]AOH83069.1 DNA polymerase [Sphingomonas panacis]